MKTVINTKLCPILGAKIMSQSREEVPVIVQFNNSSSTLKENINSLSNSVKRNLPLIGGFAGLMTTDIIYKIVSNPEIDYISFDSRVYTLLDIAAPTMDAYFPHDKGYNGEGITVAVIDTGVAPHNDLTRPNNRIVGFKDLVNNKTDPYDDNGHGTHVAGIIAASGYSSGGKYVGIAPKANILGIKALDKSGGGNISDIIDAISYIVATKDKYNTKIINLSLGTPANNSCDKDPLCKAVDMAINAGLIVVVAAGNSGPEKGTILSPGINKNVITVGAIDDKRTIDPSDDTIAPFSSRGPTSEGLIKPDVLAPGANINSLSNTKLNGYTSLSGTSMATPLVSGSIALLLNKHKDLSPQEAKNKLIKSSIALANSPENYGIGVLNLKLLFNDGKDSVEGNIKSSSSFIDNDLIETFLMLLIIVFLLDSRF
ncbi:S8 family peptidase [Tissierella sp. MB52-C2]|uniref:S8 family peptidase n=1 Tax=Tissierella sp. MB52-C2 TaxID=3070999 RepID=UPI00280C354A|nr:S8 family peptidase [Tissierella sp. MB52-C2]WMM24751.1 S8 family peptidase [Tissierella sp. MB52-C2]